ncbi:MAG TPA: metalloregulator ArsR/SmtB family transcription factor [Bacillota bacterium]|nr:metalloregulator ArsR/SmtB family transcription factor [Bacillota bacterium]
MNWYDRIIINKTPNFYMGALALMEEYFEFQAQHMNEPDWSMAWKGKSLVSHPENFSLTASEIDLRFSDVFDYLNKCREEALRVVESQDELGAYFTLNVPEQTKDMSGFLKTSLIMSDVESIDELGRDDFVTCCLLGLHDLAGIEGDFDIGSPEEQDWFYRAVDPNFDMGELFKIITATSLSDGDQMQLLRFFQDIDKYYEQVKNALFKLEDICRRNFPLVRARYEEKIQELERGQGKKYYIDLLEQVLLKADDFRTQDKVHIEVGIIGYGSLAIRFSSWERLRLRVSPGLLFAELSLLEDKGKYRDKMTQRQLKAISDPTRYKIIRQLSIRPQYGKELANALGLTAATLSHHLATLQQAMLVGVSIEGRKSYYSIRVDELTELGQAIMSMAQRSRMGE